MALGSECRLQAASASAPYKYGTPNINQSVQNLTPLEILNGAFVFLCRSLCLEGAEISSLTRLWIFLARIQPIFAGFQLPDHFHRVFADEVDSAR